MNGQRPWHIAHIIGRLSTGGAERQLVNYLLSADRKDFRHTVLCLSARRELADLVEANGIPVVLSRVRIRSAPLGCWRLVQWLRREDVAIVHTHMYDAALWGRLAGKLAGVPVLMTTEHGEELWKGPLHIAIDRGLSRWTDQHIAVSRDGLELRLRRERVDPSRILVIPNGVPIPPDPENEAGRSRIRRELGIPPTAPVIGSVGRIIEAKGYVHLLAALRLLRADIPDLRWLAVGDGKQKALLMNLSADLGVDDAVIWAGRRDDVDDLLAAMDLWVMSSVSEGLPVALLEAMAAQKPIVATEVGGIPDAVIDGRQALLVPPADPQALADAIRTLVHDPARASDLARAARHRAIAEYSIAGVARQIEALYRQHLRRAGLDPSGS